MAILLQNREKEFLKEDGTWTPNRQDAKEFETASKAIDVVVAGKLQDISLVMKRAKPENDLIIPIGKRKVPPSVRKGINP